MDTNGQELGLLDIQLPDGVRPNALVKTTIDGTPYMFRSELITYDKSYGTVDEWLNSLTYSIYGYGMENYTDEAELLFNVTADQTGLVQKMLEQGFEELDIQKIDGSGFIIDLDADGTADLVRMLLVDQGWFDTRPMCWFNWSPLLPLVISESNLSTKHYYLVDQVQSPKNFLQQAIKIYFFRPIKW